METTLIWKFPVLQLDNICIEHVLLAKAKLAHVHLPSALQMEHWSMSVLLCIHTKRRFSVKCSALTTSFSGVLVYRADITHRLIRYSTVNPSILKNNSCITESIYYIHIKVCFHSHVLRIRNNNEELFTK